MAWKGGGVFMIRKEKWYRKFCAFAFISDFHKRKGENDKFMHWQTEKQLHCLGFPAFDALTHDVWINSCMRQNCPLNTAMVGSNVKLSRETVKCFVYLFSRTGWKHMNSKMFALSLYENLLGSGVVEHFLLDLWLCYSVLTFEYYQVSFWSFTYYYYVIGLDIFFSVMIYYNVMWKH